MNIKHENTTICISNGGKSSKYHGLWLASTSSRFDSEVLRNAPLLIHLTLGFMQKQEQTNYKIETK
jgi:hypothetical protein